MQHSMHVAGLGRCVRLLWEVFAATLFMKGNYARLKIRTFETMYDTSFSDEFHRSLNCIPLGFALSSLSIIS